ncbi:sulfatase-like hydrolase/transferase [Devosia enhydra]|nr:sulfatase-like hydrolase/transferase [Devosia enhydra]
MAPTRNLLVFHLESVAWQTVNAFPEAFPNLSALMTEALCFTNHFSAATSTQMVLGALAHANHDEFDAAPWLDRPAGNNPSLFHGLAAQGYRTQFFCLMPFPDGPMFPLLSGSLPPFFNTNHFGELLEGLTELMATPGFAAYVWNVLPHIETSLTLASHAEGLDDLAGGACAVTDTLLGAVLDVLKRSGRLSDTTIVVFGDHGDDYWTHGFKGGKLHGLEPYAALVHTPLLIRDPALAAGRSHRLASTIDIGPTVLDLWGQSNPFSYPGSGRSLLSGEAQSVVFSQNFTANQSDSIDHDTRKAFAAIDASHLLMASSRGLELFNHRLDPTNHTNLLHFFELLPDGRLDPVALSNTHPHFSTIRHMWRGGSTTEAFTRLRQALYAHVSAKSAYVAARRPDHEVMTLDLAVFDRINRHGQDRFFGGMKGAPPSSSPEPRQRRGLRRLFHRKARRG